MFHENLDHGDITKARQKALRQSIRSISIDELKSLGESLFPTFDNPWREVFFEFIKENSGSTFYYARTHDRVKFVYCHARDKGIWFMPEGGAGPLQARGLKIMKEIVEGKME